MPAFLLEEPYDQEGPDGNNVNRYATQPVRRYEWWGWLSTIGGYIAGNGYVWPFKSRWKDHLDTPGARPRPPERVHAVDPVAQLVPSGLNGMRTLITAGGSSVSFTDYVAAAATPVGQSSSRLHSARPQRLHHGRHGRDEWGDPARAGSIRRVRPTHPSPQAFPIPVLKPLPRRARIVPATLIGSSYSTPAAAPAPALLRRRRICKSFRKTRSARPRRACSPARYTSFRSAERRSPMTHLSWSITAW